MAVKLAGRLGQRSEGSPAAVRPRRRAGAHLLALACLATVAAALTIYWPVLGFGFWYDDPSPNLVSVESQSPLELLLPVDTFGYYRPVGLLFLWAVVRPFGGYSIPWCHAVLLAIHLANAVLLARLVLCETGRRRTAWVAGAALALSPLAPQAVAYFAGFWHPLVLLLLLLAWGAYRRALTASKPAGHALLTTLLLFLAGGVHEVAVLLGVWVVAMPWLLRQHPWRKLTQPAAWLPLLGPTTYMAARLALVPGGGLELRAGVLDRARILSQALIYPAQLTLGDGWLLVAGLAALALLFSALLSRPGANWRLLLWGTGWLVLSLAPSAFFLETDYVAHGSRLGYVGGLGAAIVWGLPLAALLDGTVGRRWRLVRQALAMILIVMLLIVPLRAVRQQVDLFAHTSRIVSAMVEQAWAAPEDKPLIWINLPYYWMPETLYGSGWRAPLPWFRWAQIVLPDYVDAHLLVRANNGPRREMTQYRYPAYGPDVVYAGEEVSASRLRDLAESAQVYVLDLGTATFVDLTALWGARDSGQPGEREQALLAPLRTPRELPADSELDLTRPLECQYPEGLRLHSVALPEQVLPGGEASVALFWRLAEPWFGQDPLLRFAVTDAQGGSIYSQTTTLVPGLPLALWDADQVYVTRLILPVPAGARVGLAEVRIELGDAAEALWRVEGCPAVRGDRSVRIQLLIGERSLATSDAWAMPASPDAVLADGIALVGATLDDPSPAPGDTLTLTLFWRASEVPERDYTVFRQVLNAAGQVVAQADSEPNRGLYPTRAWQRGEVVRDAQELVLPGTLPEGEYRILVGMYRWPDLVRLAVTEGGDEAQDAIEVAILDVKNP